MHSRRLDNPSCMRGFVWRGNLGKGRGPLQAFSSIEGCCDSESGPDHQRYRDESGLTYPLIRREVGEVQRESELLFR